MPMPMPIEVDEIFDKFKKQINYIILYQIISKSISIQGLEQQKKTNKLLVKLGEESIKFNHEAFKYKDILKDEIIEIQNDELNFDQLNHEYVLHLNKQYQWLLVEAYEVFEDYLTKLYANIGYLDNDFWQMQDFGEYSINEIKDLNVDWFIDQTIKKRDKPKSILAQIKKKMPSLTEKLAPKIKDNPNEDYEFMMSLISEIRHIIVHNNGKTNKSEFCERVLIKIGRCNNGKPSQAYADVINPYFGSSEKHSDLVVLTNNKFNKLLGVIVSYATLIHGLTPEHFVKKINKA